MSLRPSGVGANAAQTTSSAGSDRFCGHQAGTDCQSLASNHAASQGGTTDEDSALIALGKQFEEIAAELRALHAPAEPASRLERIEAVLARLEPLERAIMTMPASTTAGLGVKARHVAYVMSEYWNDPMIELTGTPGR
jgi:hypothetical protein